MENANGTFQVLKGQALPAGTFLLSASEEPTKWETNGQLKDNRQHVIKTC